MYYLNTFKLFYSKGLNDWLQSSVRFAFTQLYAQQWMVGLLGRPCVFLLLFSSWFQSCTLIDFYVYNCLIRCRANYLGGNHMRVCYLKGSYSFLALCPTCLNTIKITHSFEHSGISSWNVIPGGSSFVQSYLTCLSLESEEAGIFLVNVIGVLRKRDMYALKPSLKTSVIFLIDVFLCPKCLIKYCLKGKFKFPPMSTPS